MAGQEFDRILATAGVAYWAWQPAEDRLAYSPGFSALLGTPAENLPSSTAAWQPLIHRDDRAAFSRFLARAAAATTDECDVRLRSAEGLWRWFSARISPGAPLLLVFRDVTAQKQTEAALRDSHLRYRALYVTSPLACIQWNQQGRIAEWNTRAEALFGWQAEEVIGREIHQLLLPAEEHEPFRASISALCRRQGDGTFSGVALGKERSLYCRWYNIALRSNQGHLIGILSLILDVSKEQRARERLASREHIYRSLVETSPDGILLLRRDGTIQTANQQGHALFGLDERAELAQVNFREFLSADGSSSVAELLDNPEECAGLILSRQERLARRGGSAFEAELAITALMTAEGAMTGLVLFVRDISERLRNAAELELHRRHLETLVQERTAQLEEAHETLAKIIDGSPVPTLVLDADHVITHWNHACERIIGVPASQMIGTRNQWRAFYPDERPILADLVMEEDSNAIAQLYGSKGRPSQVLEGGFEAEDFFPAFGRWLFFTAAPLRDSAGRIVGAIETLQEVSERKNAEIAMIQAKQVAEAAAQAKATFLANISHEIRTPMNAIIGLAHLLLNTALDEKQRDYVSRVRGAGKMLLGLINDVLDFSKIEAGQMVLETTTFTLDDVLNDVATIVVAQAQEKGLELQYLVEPEVPPRLVGDPLRLSQILVNLVGNAIKFTARGTINVLIRNESIDANRVSLAIDVQDSGIGISEEQQKNLFRAFSQADSSITRRYGGSGLGLTICQRLVNMMGGQISVISQTGVGSTFTFNIQLGIAPWEADQSVVPANHSILVVDDNPVARVVLTRLLEKAGCRVTTADSGEQAMALLEAPDASRFDCITLDLNMPDMDGLALAHAIRTRVSPVPRLVMITASDINTPENAAAISQFDWAVNKPLTAVQIAKLVANLGTPARTAATPTAADLPAPGVRLATEPGPLAGMRILVAEDIDTNRLIINEILADFGATVDTVVNGKEAVSRVQSGGSGYDAILMDIQMPEMDGLEATRQIRAGRCQPNLPIIAMTAHAFDEEQRRCRTAGMNEFLTKPVDPELLKTILLRWKPTARPATASSGVQAPGGGSLPPLPGLDVAEGLRRMMNKTALYERVLRDFCQRFRAEDERIAADLAAGDIEGARRRAHSIKGLAGSIGAAELQEFSRTLENAIAEKAPDIPQHLGNFREGLAAIIGSISSGFGIDT